MTIFVILLIYKFIKGTFEYEKVTRFELIIIPVYSAIMMVLSLENVRSLTAAGLTIILLILGASIGFLQASKTQIKDTNKLDSHQRPILKVKRNWPYLVGWLVSVAQLSLPALQADTSSVLFYGAHINATEISHELFEEVLKDLSTIAFFRSHNAWFIWVLNVATSFTYGACLMVRYPKIREAVRRKK